AFDAATSAVTPWNPDASGSATVLDIALADSSLFAGGAFSTVGGEIHRSVVEVNLTTGTPLSRIGGTTGTVYSVQVHGDSLYFGGDFTTVNFLDHRYLSGFDLNTGAILDTPQPLDIVRTLAASGDTLWVGGEFGAAVGVDRSRVAAFHANTLELLPWAPDFENIVWEIEGSPGGDTLYVAGRFDSVDGTTRSHLASFDRATGTLTSFAPAVNTTGDVYDISVTDSLVYVGGTFSTVDGQLRADLASVHRVTGALTPWDPGSSGFVNAIQAWNDTVYVGGSFSVIGDSSRTNLAAVDGSTGDVLSWGNAVALMGTSEVESFFPLDDPAFPNGALFVGGDFLNLGIGLRRGIAALHRDTGNTLYPFDARLQAGFETEVRDYALADGLLYIAGDFSGIFLNRSTGAGAVDVVTGASSPWIIDAGKPNTIAVSDSMVFVGGNMRFVQGYRHTNLAAFRRDRTPPMPATALTATPGTVDKRIELAWNASPSADVKDYLVYRTATAGADTTGLQIGVTAATSFSDDTPAYQEWFYRVYSRDQAHNVGTASNEDSAVSPMIVEPEPTVTTSIHQNPALSRYADVVVVSDSLLMQPPTVTMDGPASGAASVAMTAIAAAAAAYRGAWEFTESGVHTVTTAVVTSGGSPFEFVRTFTATLVSAADGGEARSVDGSVTLRVPGGSLHDDTFVLVENVARSPDGASTAGAPHVRIGPVGALRADAVLEIAYRPHAGSEPVGLVLARVENGTVEILPSEMLASRSVVRARVDRLGEFTLTTDPGAGGNTPRTLALHPSLPNPFRGTTQLRYDLPVRGPVRLAVYDVAGRLVSRLHDGMADAGRHAVTWSGEDERGQPVAAGVYFARVTAGSESRVLKIVRLR
ncbi:MAG TPA: FlgD immunoglobulin-like domain containing protein, partial [bacterium]|nr:FlgD immunoglobulin-like domain containing protein [bacterium]